jgi:hypothetical protein
MAIQPSNGLPGFSVIGLANLATSISQLYVPFLSKVEIEQTGNLENITGYISNGSSYLPQTIAVVQTEAPVTTVKFAMKTAEKNSFQLLAGGRFVTGNDVIVKRTLWATVAANIITDARLVGKTLADVGVELIRGGDQPSISFEKIIGAGVPTASQAKFDFTAGTITFATGLYNGVNMTYSLPVTDAVNKQTIGGPSVASPQGFNQIQFAGAFGLIRGFVMVRAPKVTKSTAFNLKAGEIGEFTFEGQAEVDVTNGFYAPVAFNWIEDPTAAGLT